MVCSLVSKCVIGDPHGTYLILPSRFYLLKKKKITRRFPMNIKKKLLFVFIEEI